MIPTHLEEDADMSLFEETSHLFEKMKGLYSKIKNTYTQNKNIVAQNCAYYEGRSSGRKYKSIYPDNNIYMKNAERYIYHVFHGVLEMDYDSIKAAVLKNRMVDAAIKKAYRAHLREMGRPESEIEENVNSLSEAWKVYYIYTLLTTEAPDYTEEPGFEEERVKKLI